jgi:prepilin-type N-terminal cleavage/methylation domain-containing protein
LDCRGRVEKAIGNRHAFTLLEVLLSVSILAVVSTITYLVFTTVTNCWKRGMAMADGLHHGDFAMEQLVMALRSTYYPDAKGKAQMYGFWLEDTGAGVEAADTISWVKVGHALVGKDCAFGGTPHRVKFTIEPDEEGEMSVVVRAWEVFGQDEDFDPTDETQVKVVRLSKRVVGFDCRVAYEKIEGTDEIDWLDEWEETNRVPTVAELTLYLAAADEDDEPTEIKRAVGIPVAPLSWRK